jgi:hypothetical protein
MSDFHVIPNLKDWVYDEQKAFQTHLEENLGEGDIVVTHHMPSDLVIHDLFKGSVINRFFVCDYTELIMDRKPALWLFGHTHMPTDIMIGETRYSVVAYSGNPFTKSGRGPLLCRPENIKTVCLCVNYAETFLLAQ